MKRCGNPLKRAGIALRKPWERPVKWTAQLKSLKLQFHKAMGTNCFSVIIGQGRHPSRIRKSPDAQGATPSLRAEPVGGAHRGDDIVNCLDSYGGVGLVAYERIMGGVRVTVETVGRQGGQVVLLRLPLIVGS